jgi:molybdopterin synthase sulfur carrier subunit
MALINIPSAMRKVTGGQAKVEVPGATVGEALDELERLHPGIRDRLVEDDRVRGGLALFVDGEMPRGGLKTPLKPESEVYFAPAVAGGC